MKYLITVAISFLLGGATLFAQSGSTAVKVDALRSAIGTDKKHVRVLFIGNKVLEDFEKNETGSKSLKRFKAKSDVFVVFSQETQTRLLKNTKKKVVLAKNHETFFRKFWREQDYLTWVKLNGEEVKFLHTTGSDHIEKESSAEGYTDEEFASYITSITDTENEVSVLAVGWRTTKEFLDTLNIANELQEITPKLTHVIVGSEQIREVMKKKTALPVVIADKEDSKRFSLMKTRWVVVEAKGSNLVRVRGSANLKSILKPRSERDKLQE